MELLTKHIENLNILVVLVILLLIAIYYLYRRKPATVFPSHIHQTAGLHGSPGRGT